MPANRRASCGLYLRVLACLLASFLSPAVLAQVELGDTEFDVDNDWVVFGPWINPADAQNSDFEAVQQTGGGLDGAFLQLTHTLPTVASGSVGSWVALINEKLVLDPCGFNGAEPAVLDFHIDARRVGDAYSRIFTLAVRQDGFVWVAIDKRIFLNEDGWTSLSIEGLGAADFAPFPYVNDPAQPARPDFSPGAAAVNVGIATGLSCPSTSDCTTVFPKQSDIDNFFVSAADYSSVFSINPGLNDAWYNALTNGQGFLLTVFPAVRQMFVAWFTFDTERPPENVAAILGDPGHRWLTAQGPYTCDTASLSVYLTEGGVFDAAEPMADNDGVPDGTMTIEFSGCTEGLVTYQLDSPAVSGEIPVQRIVDDNVALCEALSVE